MSHHLSIMKRLVLATLLCGFLGANGSPIQEEKCFSPQITVIGNHYSPQKNCETGDLLLQKLIKVQSLYSMMRSSGKQGLEFSLESLTSLVTETVQNIVATHITKPLKNAIICTACKSVIETVKYGLSTGATEEALLKMVGGLMCDYLQLFSTVVCNKYLKLAGYVSDTEFRPILLLLGIVVDVYKLEGILLPSILYIINSTTLTSEVTCSFALAESCDIETPPELDWDIPIPEKPSKINHHTPKRDFKDGKPVIKLLHLADTHIDDQYVEASWDECDLPLCCRDPPPTNTSTLSGKWGGWKCDIPARTFESLLDFVVNNITDVDHVVWTGDIPAHDLWAQSKNKNLELINKTISTLKSYFKGENSVLPSLGNHEPVPGNLLPTGNVTESNSEWSNDWLYNSLAAQWTSDWLSINDDTIKNGAFYKTEYRPGLVVVSINSVFCYFNNWWLILDNKDPGGELAWLTETLLEAEQRGQKVHIIAHVPPGSTDCLKVWQRNYYRIIERFEDTVAAQFFGHTHNDEFSLILNNEDKKKASSLMLIGPSATTYTYLNPGFRIYYIDGDYENSTRSVLDFETWILDLEESNRIDSPVWKKLYSAKEAYGLESMAPDQWRNVYEKIKTDDQVLQQYHRFFWKDSPKRPECDDACRNGYLCSIVSCVQYGDPENNNGFW